MSVIEFLKDLVKSFYFSRSTEVRICAIPRRKPPDPLWADRVSLMKLTRVSIASLGYDVPPAELTSEALEDRLAPVYERLKVHSGRLELMTGIRARRFWPEPVMPSDVAARAGRMALDRGGISPDKIGCLIHASVCRDFLEPATANVVHEQLGLPGHAVVFDVSNACLGVMNGILMAANMIELGQIEAGLVVAGENGKPLVDSTVAGLLSDASVNRKRVKQAFASLTIGSGAAAVLVARSDLVPEGHPIRAIRFSAATEHHRLCRGGAAAEGHAPHDSGVGSDSQLDMNTDAEALLHAGLELAQKTWAELAPEGDFVDRKPDRVITHQVGKAHHVGLFAALGLDVDTSFTTFETMGNMGSVSWPLTLGLAEADGFVAPGHRLAVLGIGSGLSCGMMGVDW